MQLPHAAGHLTYCSNVHPGESWAQVRAQLERELPAVKRRVSPDAPMGVGLRLSARAARELRAGDELPTLRERLAERGLYVFTLNGFPYGPFHGTPVKAGVYAPDWSTTQRLDYTLDLAEVLAALLPEGVDGSISTVPGGFRPDCQADGTPAAMAEHLLDAAAALARVHAQTGKAIGLCLEPEPHCLLETVAETVAFFERHLWSAGAQAAFAHRTGFGAGAAAEALRRHLGMCLDTCHAAVEYEQVDDLWRAITAAALPVHKMQLSAGLRIEPVTAQRLDALRPYLDGVYLHQVVARTHAGELLRFLDLPEALDSDAARSAQQWRVHFHVPIFLPDVGSFGTTQPFLVEVLRRHRAEPLTQHLEVETYTWGVLPQALRKAELADELARELHWVRQQLGAVA